ncbi:MAG: endo-1,4-beta-xylanase [Verrucomicrobiota bacterium]|jgi:endo-1,4-beta-xylanase
MKIIENILSLTIVLLAISATAQPAEKPVTLKDTFQAHFLVGTAVNRNMAMGGTGFRRSAEQTAKDIALLKEQFNQITADIANNAATTEGGLLSDADKKLADAYAGIFRAFLKHRDSVKMVTFWGVNDAVSWPRQGRPLLFDSENKPKLAFDAVIAEAKNASAK